MKVLLVSDFVPPVRGGLEFHVDALASSLVARGHEVHVATLTRNAKLTNGEVRVHTVSSASRLLPHEAADRPFHVPLPEPVSRGSLKKIVDLVQPDVVHAHSWLGVSLPFRGGPPVVLTAHDYGYVCQLRTLLNSDGELCSGPALGKCLSCAKHRDGVITTMLMTPATIVGRHWLEPKAVLAVSRAVGDALQPFFDTPIEVVPNFVGPEPAGDPLPPAIPEGPFALYAGDPGLHKGVGDLLEIWGGAAPPPLPLVLATTKPLERQVQGDVITCTLTKAQMVTAWRAATVALAPSRWADPCPTVVLEAMRAGTPLIGTTVGGTVDMVRDGIDGFLVAPGDQRAIRDRVTQLTADAELARRLGASAQERATGYFAGPVVDRIVDTYARVVATCA